MWGSRRQVSSSVGGPGVRGKEVEARVDSVLDGVEHRLAAAVLLPGLVGLVEHHARVRAAPREFSVQRGRAHGAAVVPGPPVPFSKVGLVQPSPVRARLLGIAGVGRNDR